MIELKEGTQVHSFWFVKIQARPGDWLACVIKQAGGPWKGIYRFRWYRDNKTFDSDDEKSWYTVTTQDFGDEAPEALVVIFETLTTQLSGGDASLATTVTVKGNAEKAINALKDYDFVNIRQPN